jgi:hypothetical protein
MLNKEETKLRIKLREARISSHKEVSLPIYHG